MKAATDFRSLTTHPLPPKSVVVLAVSCLPYWQCPYPSPIRGENCASSIEEENLDIWQVRKCVI